MCVYVQMCTVLNYVCRTSKEHLMNARNTHQSPPHTHLPKRMSACLNGRTDVFVFTLPVSLQSVNVWAESSRNISSAIPLSSCLLCLAVPSELIQLLCLPNASEINGRLNHSQRDFHEAVFCWLGPLGGWVVWVPLHTVNKPTH